MTDAELIISGLRGPCDDCDGNEHNTCLRCQMEFDAADEIERLRKENANLRRELEEANAEIGDLEDCRESLRKLGEYCGCDHVECADERQLQERHIHDAFISRQDRLHKAMRLLRRKLGSMSTPYAHSELDWVAEVRVLCEEVMSE